MTTVEATNQEGQPNEPKAWYVVRSTFNRGMKAYEMLTSNGFHAYIPMHEVEKPVKGRLQLVSVPLIPNMLFVFAQAEKLKDFVREHKDAGYLSLYYDHFSTTSRGTDRLLTVPTVQMDNFIKATSVRSRHTMLVDPATIRYKSGDKVRIVEGDFMGVVGKVARVGGQSRVIVTLDGVCSIATAYIPSAFLEPYDESDE